MLPRITEIKLLNRINKIKIIIEKYRKLMKANIRRNKHQQRIWILTNSTISLNDYLCLPGQAGFEGVM